MSEFKSAPPTKASLEEFQLAEGQIIEQAPETDFEAGIAVLRKLEDELFSPTSPDDSRRLEFAIKSLIEAHEKKKSTFISVRVPISGKIKHTQVSAEGVIFDGDLQITTLVNRFITKNNVEFDGDPVQEKPLIDNVTGSTAEPFVLKIEIKKRD